MPHCSQKQWPSVLYLALNPATGFVFITCSLSLLHNEFCFFVFFPYGRCLKVSLSLSPQLGLRGDLRDSRGRVSRCFEATEPTRQLPPHRWGGSLTRGSYTGLVLVNYWIYILHRITSLQQYVTLHQNIQRDTLVALMQNIHFVIPVVSWYIKSTHIWPRTPLMKRSFPLTLCFVLSSHEIFREIERARCCPLHSPRPHPSHCPAFTHTSRGTTCYHGNR